MSDPRLAELLNQEKDKDLVYDEERMLFSALAVVIPIIVGIGVIILMWGMSR